MAASAFAQGKALTYHRYVSDNAADYLNRKPPTSIRFHRLFRP